MRRKEKRPRKRWCHYCGAYEDLTRDHIVPKSRRLGVNYRDIPNVVVACRSCNNRKADKRSDCRCPVCMAAWSAYGPTNWERIPIIELKVTT